MKKIFLIVTLSFSLSALADLEHSSGMGSSPESSTIEKTHACFQEFETHGCGHPREQHEHFRNCVNESGDKISQPCRALFQSLYQG